MIVTCGTTGITKPPEYGTRIDQVEGPVSIVWWVYRVMTPQTPSVRTPTIVPRRTQNPWRGL